MAEILHQLIGSLSNYLKGFIHPRLARFFSINSMFTVYGGPKGVFGVVRCLRGFHDPKIWRGQ